MTMPSRAPRLGDVLRTQFRATGFALRAPIILAAGFAVVATVFLAIQVAIGEMRSNFHIEPSALPGIIGALLPIAVWAREERFGPGFMWSLPVDRSRHALIRTLAGWLWLMGGLVLYVLCQLLVVAVGNGDVLPVETLNVLAGRISRSTVVDPSALQVVQWAPGPMIWAVPFGAATATYLLGSALMLGVRHPLRWVIGLVVAVPVATIAAGVVSHVLRIDSIANAPARAVSSIVDGRYGLEALLTLRTWSLDTRATLTTGETVHVWSAVPDLTAWRTAALLWIFAGLLAVGAAAWRHRERRRA